MTMTDVYYDPYDRQIDSDPYPIYARLREEAPLYYNEEHDFYAVSRFEDVQRGLLDRQTFSSARGSVLEFIKANIEIPPGIVIFEDPPLHDVHRGLLSRVFTPEEDARARSTRSESSVGAFSIHSSVRVVSTSSPISGNRFRCVRLACSLGSPNPIRRKPATVPTPRCAPTRASRWR